MRERFIQHPETGKIIPFNEYRRPTMPRADYPMPMIRSDGMAATMNHADGKVYDSKSAYERAVRAKGARIVGNDRLDIGQPAPMPSARDDLERAAAMLAAGYKPPPERA